jgi:ribosomal protein S18 acetylase RimI-like enzyme
VSGIEGLSSRLAEPHDLPFLKRLFLESKAELAASLAGNPIAEGILDMQFRAKTTHYRTVYSNLQEQILVLEGQPIGCLATADEDQRIHIVDISVLEEYRNRRIGTSALTEVLSEASSSGKHVRLSVAIGNPARSLYERLGFKEISRTDTDADMVWTPEECRQS